MWTLRSGIGPHELSVMWTLSPGTGPHGTLCNEKRKPKEKEKMFIQIKNI